MVPELKRLKAMYVYEILSNSGEEMSRAEINRILWDKYKVKETPKTLKKLFTELKSENRDELLVLANGDRVVWVENIGVNSKNQVSEHTKNIVLIEKTGN